MTIDLRAYTPRLVLSWAREAPDARHRSLPGSMVFCDVSGFTALSERLARNGKVGAEELTDVLNTVFTQLLTTAAEYGGSMLKYGGDAILVFFWGAEHERRATRAAADMRAGLRMIATPIRLRMSVGIHSGSFDFFLVGSSHRELIVTGPGATRTCAAETAASAGEIVVSEGTQAALPPGCVAEDGRLRRTPSAAPVTLELPPAGDASMFVPAALRAHLLAGGEDPSHRLAAVGFLAFGGVDDLLARSGPEVVADRLDALLTVVQEACDEHGVTFLATDVNPDGGKIIVVAGAPTSFGDVEERTVRALSAVIDGFDGLALRAGLHRGSVFTGDIGPAFRRTYTVLGDVVNTAARVMASAGAGQLRATPAVLDRTETVFAAVEQPAFAAKGKRDPIVTKAVGAPLEKREERHGRLPMFGRQEELGALATAVEDAATGRGRLVEVVGEGGIGKTRLLHELLETTASSTTVTAGCEQYEMTTPYFAARQLLVQALGLDADPRPADLTDRVRELCPDLVAWAPLVGMPLAVSLPTTPEVEGLDDRFVKQKMHSVLAELVRTALSAPARWIIEDAQWLDDASRELVAALLADVGDRPWAVFVSRRPEDHPVLPGQATEMVVLRPLLDEDAAGLARAAAPGGLLPPEAELVARRAAGHPLFVRELAQAFSGEEADELPDSIGAVITARIDALAPADRAALRVASVLGSTFSVGVLRELAPAADLRSLRAFVTVRGDNASFRQALFQQVAYDALPFRQRRILHGAAVRLLAAEDALASDEVLSLHALEGQLFAEAWSYASRAAESAAHRWARTEAIALYRRALRAARSLPDLAPEKEAEASIQLGRLLVRAGRLGEAKSAYTHARRLIGDVPRLLLNEGEVRAELGSPVQAMRWFRRGLRRAGEGDDGWRVLLLAAVARLRLSQGELAAGATVAREALTLAVEAQGKLDSAQLANVWSIAGNAAMLTGGAESVEHFQRALELYRRANDRIGEANVLNNLGMIAYNAGNLDEALEYYRRSRDSHNAAGASIFAATAANNIGEVLADQGRDVEARAAFDDALATFEVANSWYAAYVEANIGAIEARLGQHDVARDWFAKAVRRFRAAGADSEVARVESLAAEAVGALP